LSVIKGNHAGSAGSDFYSYKINQSLRFNDGDSAYLTRDPSSAGDLQKFTYSVWFKRSALSAAEIDLFSAGDSSTDRFEIILSAAYPDQLEIYMNTSGTVGDLVTTQVFRDVSAWYHLVVAFDTTQSTASNRVKIYINGSQITSFATETYPSQNFNTAVNSTSNQYISKRNYVDDRYYDGYMAEINMIDGQQLTPSSFGETKDGVWVPKSSSGLTFGTNGFYLPFDDSSAIGDDESSNTNDFTANNLAATDVVKDSPTNNFATMSPLLTDTNNTTFSEGNLKTVNSAASTSGSSIAVNSGKWFVEMVCTAKTATNAMIGICTVDGFDGQKQLDESDNGGSGHGYVMNATKLPGGASYGATWAIDDIIGVALDLDSGQNTVTFYKNGSSQGAINIDNALYVFCNSNGQGSSTVTYVSNFGQDGTFAGEITAGGNSDGNGVGDFKYSVPSGYLALCTANLPDPTIGPTASTIATDNFNSLTYTGDDGSSRAVTGVGFSPDWVWIKNRDVAEVHALYDTVRGATYYLSSNNSDTTQDRGIYGLRSFDSDGFTLGAGGEVNDANEKYVAWNWKAGGSASSNSDGDITSSVSANTAAGFSIATFTKGSGNQTVGHGLSVAPDFLAVKRTNGSGSWFVYHSANTANPETDYLRLNELDGTTDNDTVWNDTAPTSTVFTVGTAFNSGEELLCYALHSVEGYSKFGGYTGNGSADGPFVFTGHRVAWVMLKRGNTLGHWQMYDEARHPDNVNNDVLYANLADDETSASSYGVDFLSNGFKVRTTGGDINASGSPFIYLAFAEAPFKFSNAR
jgi:hypothetical protein